MIVSVWVLVGGCMPLTQSEFDTACSIVMGEAGGESERGIMLVAQSLRDGCEREGVQPSELRSLYRYEGWMPDYSGEVERAVYRVFFLGHRVTAEETLVFYNPELCVSTWHEAQNFVTQEGSVRFFNYG